MTARVLTAMTQPFKDTYAPELEDIKTIARSLEAFRESHLSGTTDIAHVLCQPGNPREEKTLASSTDIANLPSISSACHQLFFIYKYLVQRPLEPVPDDANKLQISASSLESLTKHLTLPAAFIFALTRYYLPNGRGSRQIKIGDKTCHDTTWYFLPVRVQVETVGTNPPSNPPATTDDDDASQMNPFYKLHLPNVQRDIHRSCVGIFSRVESDSRRFTFVAFDFMHGRWPKVALEPRERIGDVLKRHPQSPDASFGREHCVHLVYLTSATRWWTNSLSSVNEQLIAYERRLQAELDRAGTTPESVLTELNRALHSIAAHLQRYLSELKSLRGIAADLSADYASVHENDAKPGNKEALKQAARGFAQVLSQVDAAHELAVELEKKTQNILALLFNRIQISSDRLLVANGEAMQGILRAMQEDASLAQRMATESHRLAQEMKKDSIAMKTIAIVTMFFLPGATFATLLSMPFFSDNEWMGHASRFWIWVVFSVPSTAACFIFYSIWRKRAQELVREAEDGVPLQGLPNIRQNGHVR